MRGWDRRNINNLLKYVGTERVGDMQVVLLAPPYQLTGVKEDNVRLIPIDLTQNTGVLLTEMTTGGMALCAATCRRHCGAGEHAAYIANQRQLMGLAVALLPTSGVA